jgi:tetratricopeptide (TPR) repeat protein
MYRLSGDYGKAASYYQKAYELDPKRNRSFLSMVRFGLKGNVNPETYFEQIESSLASNPGNANFIWAKGYVL